MQPCHFTLLPGTSGHRLSARASSDSTTTTTSCAHSAGDHAKAQSCGRIAVADSGKQCRTPLFLCASLSVASKSMQPALQRLTHRPSQWPHSGRCQLQRVLACTSKCRPRPAKGLSATSLHGQRVAGRCQVPCLPAGTRACPFWSVVEYVTITLSQSRACDRPLRRSVTPQCNCCLAIGAVCMCAELALPSAHPLDPSAKYQNVQAVSCLPVKLYKLRAGCRHCILSSYLCWRPHQQA